VADAASVSKVYSALSSSVLFACTTLRAGKRAICLCLLPGVPAPVAHARRFPVPVRCVWGVVACACRMRVGCGVRCPRLVEKVNKSIGQDEGCTHTDWGAGHLRIRELRGQQVRPPQARARFLHALRLRTDGTPWEWVCGSLILCILSLPHLSVAALSSSASTWQTRSCSSTSTRYGTRHPWALFVYPGM